MKDLGINKTYKIGVFLSAAASYGGTFQYNLTLLKALAKIKENNWNGVSIIGISPANDWIDLLRKDYPNFSVLNIYHNIFHRAVGKVLKSTKFGLFVWRKINRFPPFAYRDIFKMGLDLIIYPSQDEFLHEIDIPAISTIHDLMHRYEKEFPEACSIQQFKSRERQYKRICKYSTTIVVDSKLGKKHVEESYGNILKGKVIPLAYIPPPYILESSENTDCSHIIQKYKIPNEYIFYPAQFWKHKNHDNLLKSIKLLKNKGVQINAVFVGFAKNNYENILEQIRILSLEDQVKVVHYVPNEDIVALYKKSKALVMPTFFGPTNIPIIEAMYLGVPVVCSNAYAMPEQVGNAGLLFDPNNITEMVDNIYRIWTDECLRKELVQKGFDKVRSLTLESYARQWEKIIEETLH